MRKALKRSSCNSSSKEQTQKKRKKLDTNNVSIIQQLGQISPFNPQQKSPILNLANPSRFQQLLESESDVVAPQSDCKPSSSVEFNFDVGNANERVFVLSQDLFCTPDYITPNEAPIPKTLDCNEEDACPKSPEKIKTVKAKKQMQNAALASITGASFPYDQLVSELPDDTSVSHDCDSVKEIDSEFQKKPNYISQSAVALRCRVMPPPCMKNPYLMDDSGVDIDPFGSSRSKCEGLFPSAIGGGDLPRYRTDFHEIEEIGYGNFSRVFKALKRIDGCMYAVKHSTRQLHLDTERRKALMEVQAMSALGSHENIVRYYNSWIENEKIYIQMELCERSLSINGSSKLFTEGEVLLAMHQIAKALQYIHERGVAHLDVKPDNIYVKNDGYKLGDFGCATLLDTSLPIEEGDARYMPQEILNEKYDHLDKVDVFSLGATIYELAKGSALPESGPHFLHLREGKLPLLPGHSIQFQNLLKAMMDPDPARRPSAKEVVENSLFDRIRITSKTR
ncbi:wee1-like protein kinase [Daucus carota subsp. sativus]|uniref:Wee1-like protein kinase n=1 Tax=Daucus carota subsp. sativus TaxID=79200 RepID=A0A162A4A9_DAUCS|nr:PREDICTED: wee1-like protein kinase [Daucus carota subsp. sativus]